MTRIFFQRKTAFVIFAATILSVPPPAGQSQVYVDEPFLQEVVRQYRLPADEDPLLLQVRSNRNGNIIVRSSGGLLQPHERRLVPYRHHRPLTDMDIRAMDTYGSGFVFLSDNAVLSNAHAGKLYVEHSMQAVTRFCMGDSMDFLIAVPAGLGYFRQGRQSWSHLVEDQRIIRMIYDQQHSRFLVLTNSGLYQFRPENTHFSRIYSQGDCTDLALTDSGQSIIIGTCNGYLQLNTDNLKNTASVITEVPWPEITCVRNIQGRLWFGTTRGAFTPDPDGGYNYYASRRWLPDDRVVDMAPGPDGSVLILTETGLSHIRFERMTLADKARHFEQLTRRRHVRYGFNSKFTLSEPGDLSTGTLKDQDNDGLWTSMYLAGELFRYAVTESGEALQNCYQAFEALERLEAITPMDGFPARAVERSGYFVADPERWQPAGDNRWDWKATTSSDEIVGHFFAYGLFAEIVPDTAMKERAVDLMDRIMAHIVRNDWYLIDYDGQPTRWGRWNPEYVNQFPRAVGDRRLNSIEIIAFLQTAYHFTGKEVYKKKAYQLLDEHGYLENIMTPITEIGRVDGIDLSDSWNHSDDELAFLSYWNLYRYAFTGKLREQYSTAIKDHWEIERPEKNPLWSFIYGSTGAEEIDLEAAIWFLQEFPLDMIDWTIRNSHRKDITKLEPNFRNQTVAGVLPPYERPLSKFNGNAFRLDGGSSGHREYSGDIYLLPYWMGRYLKLIE